MTCKVNADTTNGLKLESDTSGAIDLQSNGTTRVSMDASGNVTATSFIGDGSSLTGIAGLPDAIDVNASAPADSLNIDASGNVGIGTSSPEAFVHLSSNSPRLMLTDTDTGADHRINADSSVGNLAFDADFNSNTSTPSVVFNIKGSEKMRIDSDGFVGIGVTTTQGHLHVDSEDVGSIFGRACIAATTADPTGDSLNQLYVAAFTGDSNVTNATFLSMRDSDGEIGNITANGASSVAYNTSSDYRLKENVNYTFDATTRLKQLRPCRFNFIADPDTTKDGFLAHEVSSIVPEAVTGTHDETRECVNVVKKADGKMIHENVSEEDWTQGKTDGTYAEDTTWSATATVPRYQGIDQSKLVPLLVKTIQELEARITALENN
jgi:hypothetical protein